MRLGKNKKRCAETADKRGIMEEQAAAAGA